MGGPSLRRAAALALVCVATAASLPATAAPPDPKPDAAATAQAKKLFDSGKKLLAEGSYREALAAFVAAKSAMPRESIQRNIAYCHRELRDFASAYEAYVELVDTFGAKMKKADLDAAKKAIDELRILSGTIRVAVFEPGAKVEIAGREVGTTPVPKPVRVNVGSFKVTLSKSGFEPLSRTVDVKGGDEIVLDTPMTREVLTGRVFVTFENRRDATLFVDGKETPGPYPWEGDLPPGTHEFEAKGPSVAAAPRRIDVVRGQRVELTLKVEALVAKLTIEGAAADAAIFVDAVEVGKGAWEGDVAQGRHDIRVTREGYQTIDRVVIAHVGETLVIRDLAWTSSGPAIAALPEADYKGLYAHFDAFGTLAATSNELANGCPTSSPPLLAHCGADNQSLGAGLTLRIGYSFGWLALEGFGLGAYDRAKGKQTFDRDVPPTATPDADHQGVARSESFTFQRYGGGFGLGGRATSMHPSIRFTGGLGAGLVLRRMVYARDASASSGSDTSNTSDSFTSNEGSYTAPLFLADAGVLFGGTPGGKFHLGILVMMELPSGDVYAPGDAGRTLGLSGKAHPTLGTALAKVPLGTPQMRVTSSGPQVFFGPMLGVRFGELPRGRFPLATRRSGATIRGLPPHAPVAPALAAAVAARALPPPRHGLGRSLRAWADDRRARRRARDGRGAALPLAASQVGRARWQARRVLGRRHEPDLALRARRPERDDRIGDRRSTVAARGDRRRREDLEVQETGRKDLARAMRPPTLLRGGDRQVHPRQRVVRPDAADRRHDQLRPRRRLQDEEGQGVVGQEQHGEEEAGERGARVRQPRAPVARLGADAAPAPALFDRGARDLSAERRNGRSLGGAHSRSIHGRVVRMSSGGGSTGVGRAVGGGTVIWRGVGRSDCAPSWASHRVRDRDFQANPTRPHASQTPSVSS